MADQRHIKIFDTTLRDGEQSPGASMTLVEKIQIADLLDEMGVDVIEAGFPIASNGDFEAVKEISKRARFAQICGLSRAGLRDIDRAWEALQHAKNPRIHTFISTSDLHMKHKLQMSREDVLDAVAKSVSHARNLCDDVEWSPEDGTRTDRDFLCKVVDVAISHGATTINIPDTVGYTTPEEFTEIIAMLRERVPNIDKAVLSVHCHNDLGLAVANSLAGVAAGAGQVECTINGLGERAGNASLEEIVMAMHVRPDLTKAKSGIKTQYLTRISKLVAAVTGFPVQYNKAIVGKNAFAHESGIHQDGMLKNAQTYEIMTPETVGLNRSSLVMGKHSGRHAFREKLGELGYTLDANKLDEAFRRFKDLADKKKTIFDEDIIAIVDDAAVRENQFVQFVSLQVRAGSIGPQTADIELNVDGQRCQAHAEGDGPVDATFKAIRDVFPHDARLDLYQVHAVTEGTDAQAEVTVRMSEQGRTVTGTGADTDTLVASARAYVNALNKLVVRREKMGAAELDAISAQ